MGVALVSFAEVQARWRLARGLGALGAARWRLLAYVDLYECPPRTDLGAHVSAAGGVEIVGAAAGVGGELSVRPPRAHELALGRPGRLRRK